MYRQIKAFSSTGASKSGCCSNGICPHSISTDSLGFVDAPWPRDGGTRRPNLPRAHARRSRGPQRSHSRGVRHRPQVDVSIRTRLAGFDLLVAVETKDYGKRRADIGAIDAFANKLRDIRANKGIFICHSGFSKGAKSAARKWGIQLASLHDANDPAWRIDIRLPILWTDLRPTLSLEVEVRLGEGVSLPQSILEWSFSEDGGPTALDWLGRFESAWNALELPREPDVAHEMPIIAQAPALLVEKPDGGSEWVPIRGLTLRYRVAAASFLGWFTPQQCRGVLDVLSGLFEPSYLPLGAVPQVRDPSWEQVDPAHLAIETLGPLISATAWGVDRSQITAGPSYLRRIGD